MEVGDILVLESGRFFLLLTRNVIFGKSRSGSGLSPHLDNEGGPG